MKKNWLLTFICACFPGFGEMYLGYMKRGVSLAIIFWGVIFFSSFFQLGALIIFLPVIWAFGFFDTFNIRGLTSEQRGGFADTCLISPLKIKNILSDNAFFNKISSSKLIGFILIIIGTFSIYKLFLNTFGWAIQSFSYTLYNLLYSVPTFIVMALIIALGIYMVGNSKKQNPPTSSSQNNNYTFGNSDNSEPPYAATPVIEYFPSSDTEQPTQNT